MIALPMGICRPASPSAVLGDLVVFGVWTALVIVGSVHHANAQPSVHSVVEGAGLMALMMSPLATPSACVVAGRALRARRPRAAAEHVAGFATASIVFGALAAATTFAVVDIFSRSLLFAGLLLAAAVWQVSGVRRRYTDRCGHIRVAPPEGWRSTMTTITSGVREGAVCVRAGWPAMLAMVVAPHAVTMAVVLGAYLTEWAPGPNPFGRVRCWRPVPVYVVLAAFTLAVTLDV